MTASRLLCVAQDDSSVVPELALLWPLLGRRIAFHRRLVDITRSVKAALLLSQMIYWTRHGRDIAARDGWFHKTARQWELETALTAREQAHAKKKLLALDLIEERLSGAPALLHFRLVPERLAALVAQLLGRPAAHLDWADGNVVFDLLGPPLAYHRALGRAPTAREKEIALRHVAGGAVETWAEFHQAIFASVDFRYLE